MRRLTAEEVRDSILAVSGTLNLKQGGPSIYPKIPKEVLAGQSVPGEGWATSPPEEANRRSVYVHVKRSLRVPILVGFDQADTDSSCPVRYATTVPTQALGMLNGEFANEQAAAFAEAAAEGGAGRPRGAGDARDPPDDRPRADRRRGEEGRGVHRDAARRSTSSTTATALTQYCLLCLNANEFVYLD